MAKRKQQFPDQVFVTEEADANANAEEVKYLGVYRDAATAIDSVDEPTVVAVYKLVEVKTLVLKQTVEEA